MKKKLLIMLSIVTVGVVFADSQNGMYAGLSTGLGTTNLNSTSQTGFNTANDLAYRVDLGSKIDTYFGLEAGYVSPGQNQSWMVDLFLNYYFNTASRWDVLFGVGPYYDNLQQAVGVAGSFGVNYNFSKNVALTFGEYLYINPSVPASRSGDFSSYLQNNVATVGFKFMM